MSSRVGLGIWPRPYCTAGSGPLGGGGAPRFASYPAPNLARDCLPSGLGAIQRPASHPRSSGRPNGFQNQLRPRPGETGAATAHRHGSGCARICELSAKGEAPMTSRNAFRQGGPPQAAVASGSRIASSSPPNRAAVSMVRILRLRIRLREPL